MFYSLNKSVQLRKELKGCVIFLESDTDIIFFYTPEDSDILLKMKNDSACIAINAGSLEKDFLKDLSYLIRNKFLIFEENPQGEIIIIKKIPELIKLFITPTVHFRRYYSYGK